MGKILSQEEIDALLSSSVVERRNQDASDAALQAILYNFRRPDRLSKEQLRSLRFLHDRFARNISTSMSTYLRASTDVTLVSVEQFTYSEVLMSLPDPTAFYSLSLPPLDGLAALEISPAVAFAVIDRMLGGTGRSAQAERALTEIEQHVIDATMRVILESLSEVWQAIAPVRFAVQGRETRPQMLQVAAPNEVVILVGFDVRLGAARGMMNLCIPAASIEPVAEAFAQGWQRTRREPTAIEAARLSEHLGRIAVRVSAVLPSRLRTEELLRLAPGDLISLGVPAASAVELHFERQPKFRGHVASNGQQIAFTTTSRIDDDSAVGEAA